MSTKKYFIFNFFLYKIIIPNADEEYKDDSPKASCFADSLKASCFANSALPNNPSDDELLKHFETPIQNSVVYVPRPFETPKPLEDEKEDFIEDYQGFNEEHINNKTLIYFIGGVTKSEILAIKSLSDDYLIATTKIITGIDLIKSLAPSIFDEKTNQMVIIR